MEPNETGKSTGWKRTTPDRSERPDGPRQRYDASLFEQRKGGLPRKTDDDNRFAYFVNFLGETEGGKEAFFEIFVALGDLELTRSFLLGNDPLLGISREELVRRDGISALRESLRRDIELENSNRRNLDVKPAVGEADELNVEVPDGLCRMIQGLLDEIPEARELRDALHADFPNAEQRCMWLTIGDPSLGGQSPAELLQNCTTQNLRRVLVVLRPELVNAR